METLSAIRWNPTIRQFHQKLIDAGKKPKVSITARMRKLIVSLNATLKKGTVWNAHLN